MSDWRNLSPSQLLDTYLALTPTQTAYALTLLHHRGAVKGQPDKRAVIELIHAGRLALVDPSQPITRWTVSTANVRRYLEGSDTTTPRRSLRDVS